MTNEAGTPLVARHFSETIVCYSGLFAESGPAFRITTRINCKQKSLQKYVFIS
ncbi:hypothetical protein [Desulfitobacterium hafniense]|uniref:hypothetical protein n=1 Tax=Desulfitobacterium hafniense TaxID=49338 RepID=UPI001A98845C|nr:hypothetical protein [Desulfitobacterium hafniense]